MAKAIFAAVVSLVIGFFAWEWGVHNNEPFFGLAATIVVMGAFIIYFNEKR